MMGGRWGVSPAVAVGVLASVGMLVSQPTVTTAESQPPEWDQHWESQIAPVKWSEHDPLSIRNAVYTACDADGVSNCGVRPKAQLKVDPASIEGEVSLQSLRDPDGWVERIPAEQMDPHTFYHEYVLKHRPVVLTNATATWAATSKWTDVYIKKRLEKYKLRMETKDDDKYNVPDGLSADEFFSTYNTTQGLYMVDELPPTLHKDVGIPGYMHCDEITQQFFVSYLWISAGGTASQGHVDTDENLLYVIRGSKVLTMMSPLFSTALHADETRIMGVLDQNFGRLDLKKWPRYAGVRYVMAEVNAGDGVYLPQNWWHQVNSTSTHQLGVATWWKSRPEQRNIPKEVGPAGKYFKGKRLKVSYGTILENYARSVLTDAPYNATCKRAQEPRTMADYEFATDREDFVKEGKPEEWLESKSDDTKGSRDEKFWCPYSHIDARSPCFFRACIQYSSNDPRFHSFRKAVAAKDANDAEFMAVEQEQEAKQGLLPSSPEDGPGGGGTSYRCLRYILDYCHAKLTNDPQCWVELSNLMTKVSQPELEVLRRKKSELAKPNTQKVPRWAAEAQESFEEEQDANAKEWAETWERRHAEDNQNSNDNLGSRDTAMRADL